MMKKKKFYMMLSLNLFVILTAMAPIQIKAVNTQTSWFTSVGSSLWDLGRTALAAVVTATISAFVMKKMIFREKKTAIKPPLTLSTAECKELSEVEFEGELAHAYEIVTKNFKNQKMPMSRNILLYGKPGNGKTLFVKKLASEGIPVWEMGDITSKWLGESQKNFKDGFIRAQEYLKLHPKIPFGIVFLDECDRYLGKRISSPIGGASKDYNDVVSTFLENVDIASSKFGNIVVIGATNFSQGLDDAVRRRFVRNVEVPTLSSGSAKKIFYNTIERFGKGRSRSGSVDATIDELLTYNAAQAFNPSSCAALALLAYEEFDFEEGDQIGSRHIRRALQNIWTPPTG